MKPMDIAALDLDLGTRRASQLAKQGGEQSGGFLNTLLDDASFKGAGISKEKLASMLEQVRSGKEMPLDGKSGKVSRGDLADLLGLIGASKGAGEGAKSLQGLFSGELDVAKVDAKFGSGKADKLIFAEQGQGNKLFTTEILPLGEDSEGQALALKLTGKGGGGEDWQAFKAEREKLLEGLAELQEQGLQGEDLLAAMEDKLAELKDAGGLKHIDVDLVQDTDKLNESGGWSVERAGARAGSLGSSFSFGGEVADRWGERSINQNALSEQIVRELRTGGSLTALAGSAGDGSAGQNASGGNSSFTGSGNQASMESLLQSLEGGTQRGEGANQGRADFGSMFAAAQGLEGSARGSSGVLLNVQQPVGQNGFAPAVGERIDWMVKEGVKEARLQLNPPDMGALDVKVTVGEERTTVSIIAHNATTREALQEDLQRLRQMLTEQGNGEVEVNVSSGDDNEQQEKGAIQADNANIGGEDGNPDGGGEEPSEAGIDRRGEGLLDHFA